VPSYVLLSSERAKLLYFLLGPAGQLQMAAVAALAVEEQGRQPTQAELRAKMAVLQKVGGPLSAAGSVLHLSCLVLGPLMAPALPWRMRKDHMSTGRIGCAIIWRPDT